MEELQKFANKSLFPSHGLILRPGKEQFEELFKGITEPQLLEEKVHYLLKKYGSAYTETDMRAFLNPSRMNMIRQTAEKILLECPACQIPGFSVTKVDTGLPCEWCGWPTRSILAHHLTCAHCDYRQKVSNPSWKIF